MNLKNTDRRLKFLMVFIITIGILAVLRHAFNIRIPSYDSLTANATASVDTAVAEEAVVPSEVLTEENSEEEEANILEELEETEMTETDLAEAAIADSVELSDSLPTDTNVNRNTYLYKLSGKVWSYMECFPDTQEQHVSAALKNGIKPVESHAAILSLARRQKLVSIMDSPFFVVEKLDYSMPYLVPKAKDLLTEISVNFLDSLRSKGLQLFLPIITSVTRTTADVEKLRRRNRNATDNSCHSYGTTFDITYSRYMPLTGIPTPVDSATWQRGEYKLCLAEVLYDLRSKGKCYVKHERRQPCFHITVR